MTERDETVELILGTKGRAARKMVTALTGGEGDLGVLRVLQSRESRRMVLDAVEARMRKHGLPTHKSCPACDAEGPIEPLFGWRRVSEMRVIPQSQCRDCRRASTARSKERARARGESAKR